MSEKFRVAVLCVILSVFAFVLLGMSYGSLRGMFRSSRIETYIILWYVLPELISLSSIVGLLRKKIWAKWTGLVVCSYVLYRAIE